MARGCLPQLWPRWRFWTRYRASGTHSYQPVSESSPDLVPPAVENNNTDEEAAPKPPSDQLLPPLQLQDENELGHFNLEEELVRARVEWPEHGNRYFVPVDSLKRLITLDSILREFRGCKLKFHSGQDAKDAAETILNSGSRLFAILVYVRCAKFICDFLNEGLDDTDLPFVRHQERSSGGRFKLCSGKLPQKGPVKCMATWDRLAVERLSSDQWCMQAPLFERSVDSQGIFLPTHQDFDENCILPFIKDLESQQASVGGFGSVWEIRIHPAHQNLRRITTEDMEQPSFALKKLHSTNEKDFESELDMLKAFSGSRNPHLIKLLATFRWRRSYYLLFPYAASNLRQYWKNTPLPLFDESTITWSLGQCKNIARGLYRIHEYSSTKPNYTIHVSQSQSSRGLPSAPSSEHLYGRHGDIKPENILWSVEKTSHVTHQMDQRGLLLIADFGLMDFHRVESRSVFRPGQRLGTPTYAPPELELRNGISRAYDIWSLGCVYLEFITWLLCGWEDLERFPERRGMAVPVQGMASVDEVNDDTFFTIIDQGDQVHSAILRESVKQWIKELHKKPRCSAIITDFLNLVSEKMLVVDPTQRITCGHLHLELINMLKNAENNTDYLTAPGPSHSMHSVLESNASGITQSPSPTEGVSLPLRHLFTQVDDLVCGSPPISPSSSYYLPDLPPISAKPL